MGEGPWEQLQAQNLAGGSGRKMESQPLDRLVALGQGAAKGFDSFSCPRLGFGEPLRGTTLMFFLSSVSLPGAAPKIQFWD